MKTKNFKPKGSGKTIPLSIDQFEFIIDEFKDQQDFRMSVLCHLLFRCVRIGDVLNTIRVKDLFNDDYTLKEKLIYTEEKTGKLRIIPLKGRKFLQALDYYLFTVKELKLKSPLFYSKKLGVPLSDAGVKYILRKFIGKRRIKQCSPHSFRKGGARYMYDSGVRIEAICDVLNHHSTRVTEIYINITPRDIENSMRCLEI